MAERLPSSDITTHFKTLRLNQYIPGMGRERGQQNRINNPEIELDLCENLMYFRNDILIQQEKAGLNNMALGFLVSQLEESKIGSLSQAHNNVNLAPSLVQPGGRRVLNQDQKPTSYLKKKKKDFTKQNETKISE